MQSRILGIVILAAIHLLPLMAVAQQKSGPKASMNPKSMKPKPADTAAKLVKVSAASNELNQQGLRLVQLRDFTAAEDIFRRALASDARNTTAAYNLASTLIINKKVDQAIELLIQYSRKVPKDTGLLIRLGDAYLSKKDFESAEQTYNKAYEQDENYPDILTKLASVSLYANKPQAAEKFLEDQIAKNPKDGKSVANLSSIYLANGKTDEAISTAKKALQFKAEKEVYIILATAYEIQKDYTNALIAFQRAVDLGDDRIEVTQKIEKLKRIVS